MKMILHMIGNAHIDPVWLWPWQAGVDEALASFSSAADRCEEYPEFIFTRGESWLYQQVEKIDPALFRRVKRLVRRGQWHITGGQYIQPDTNHPSKAGWDQLLIHGQRYFSEHFGISPRVGYNVDSFGHPATLPDILSAHGYIGYVFHRPNPHQMVLPSQTFRWRGAGGGEVFAFHISPAYVTRTDDLYGQIMISAEAADQKLGHTLCFYGVGNHGGGPTKANIEYILEHRNKFPGIELRFSTPETFFNIVRRKQHLLPVLRKELQHTFPGCYSVMHDIKQQQRRGEHLLDQCQKTIAGFSRNSQEQKKQRAGLDKAWEDLLFTQFHDILSGTSIPGAWSSVRAMQGRAQIIAEEIIMEITRKWARSKLARVNHQQIALINPDASAWNGLVEAEPFLDFQLWGDRWISDEKGRPVEYQRVQPDAAIPFANRMIFPAKIPAQGHRLFLVRDDAPPLSQKNPNRKSPHLRVSSRYLANRFLHLELGPHGIRSLRHQEEQLLAGEGIRLHLRKDSTDTWTMHTDHFREAVTHVFRVKKWVVEESGPLRARVRGEGHLGRSRIRWTLGLHRDDPRLQVEIEVLFAEKFMLLQMATHLARRPRSWVDGLAGGEVQRKAGASEWPVQGWSRVALGKSELAWITQDAYSLSLRGKVWQWTLLRSPKMAWAGTDPEINAGHDHHTDQGAHRFQFILSAGGKLSPATLHTQARHLVQGPVTFDRYEGMNRPSWGKHPPRHLWTDAETRAIKDGRLTELKNLTGGIRGLEESP
jgi:alpha-mannosidase